MVDTFSIVISVLALSLSALTAWLTLFQKGRVKMTRPMMIAFTHETGSPKIFLRSLLYCTARRGGVIENMYANLRFSNSITTFAFWGYGEHSDLVRGGGLFVGPEGVSVNHHFTLLKKSATYEYKEGDYTLEIYATLVGESKAYKLAETSISFTEEMAELLNEKDGEVMFNWNPNSHKYQSDIKSYPYEKRGIKPL